MRGLKTWGGALRWVVLLGWSLLAHAADAPAPLVVCLMDSPNPPYNYPDREGPMQALTRQAAQAAGLTVQFVYEPRRRCVENVKAGRYQILPMVSFSPSTDADFAFPMRQGKPDVQRAMAETKGLIVMSKQATVQWDGQTLSGVKRPVLINAGWVFVQDWVRQHGAEFQEVRTTKQALQMLALDRADMALVRDSDVAELVRDGLPMTELVVHPIPAMTTPLFNVFGKQFAQDNPAVVESFWRAVAKIRATPEWKKREASFHFQ